MKKLTLASLSLMSMLLFAPAPVARAQGTPALSPDRIIYKDVPAPGRHRIRTTPSSGALAGRGMEVEIGISVSARVSQPRMEAYKDNATVYIENMRRPPAGETEFAMLIMGETNQTLTTLKSDAGGLTVHITGLQAVEKFYNGGGYMYIGRADVTLTDGSVMGVPDKYRVRFYDHKLNREPGRRDPKPPAAITGNVLEGKLDQPREHPTPHGNIRAAYRLEFETKLTTDSYPDLILGNVYAGITTYNPIGVRFADPLTIEFRYDEMEGANPPLGKVAIRIEAGENKRSFTIPRQALTGRPTGQWSGVYAFTDSTRRFGRQPHKTYVHLSSMYLDDVPDVLRNKQWTMAEQLQRLWFDYPARQKDAIWGKGGDPNLDFVEVSDPVTGDELSVPWVLSPDIDTYGEAKTAYDELTTEKYKDLESLASLRSKACVRLLEERSQKIGKDPCSQLASSLGVELGAAGTDQVNFPNPPDDQPVEGQDVLNRRYFAIVDANPHYKYLSPFREIDHLLAALGRFNLLAAPVGHVRLTGGKVEVEVTGLKIYVFDTFDFNGGQQLGCWERPDQISLLCTRMFRISNGHYQRYRQITNRGRDFNVISKSHTVNLPEPLKCSFSLVNKAAIACADFD